MNGWLEYVAVIAALIAAAASLITAVRMGRVEHNTNSISERLEKAAGLAGEARGRDDERAAQKARE